MQVFHTAYPHLGENHQGDFVDGSNVLRRDDASSHADTIFAGQKRIKVEDRPCSANVAEEAVITAKDVASIYEVPLVFSHEGVDTLVLKYLHLESRDRDLSQWEEIVHRVYNPKAEVTIGIVASTSNMKIPTSP